VDHLDDDCVNGGSSEVVQFYVKKDGTFGNLDRTDVAEREAFFALLEHVRRRVGELADQIIAGRVDIAPYRINKVTPLPDVRPSAPYAGLNRGEPLPHTAAMKRSEVFERVVGGKSLRARHLPRRRACARAQAGAQRLRRWVLLFPHLVATPTEPSAEPAGSPA
jgi:hypothetical protein